MALTGWLLLGFWGCASPDASGEATLRRWSYPVTAFRSEPRERIRGEKRPRARWQQTPEGRVPVLLGDDDFDLEVLLDEPDGASVRGRYGFFGVGHQNARPTRARFRILLRSLDGESQQLVFEDEMESPTGSVFRDFEMALPETTGEPVFLRFEVRYPGHRKLRAAWLDPVVEKWVPRPPPRGPAPSLLLITSDTTRQDQLEVYGGPAPTPHLVTLAEEGILLQRAFSVAFGTTPSHTSLFTASHPAEHGVYDNRSVASGELVTLAEVLRDAGYTTAAFVSARPVGRLVGLDQGFDTYDDVLIMDPESDLGSLARSQRRADVTVDRFLAWLDAGPKTPFFAWIHVFDPHQPYSPPIGTDPLPPGRRPEELEEFFHDAEGNPRSARFAELEEEPALQRLIEQVAIDRYRREITFVDQQLGRVFDALREKELFDELLIVYTADHGETLDEHEPAMGFGHQGLHDEVTRIPLLLKLPGGQPAATRRDFLLGNLDIAPTVLELLGVDAPGAWSGRSFRRLLEGQPGGAFRPHLILEGAHIQEISVRTPSHMYRELLAGSREREDLRGLLGYVPEQLEELYDLSADPNELRNLAAREPALVADLRDLAQQFLARHKRPEAEVLQDPEHLRALEALGYIN